jgi:MerR family transcriptional regulator, light-induced transcriptional regulator
VRDGAAAPDGGPLLTLQEAADRLKVHYMTAYRWVRKGELPAFKAGGRLRVREEVLVRFMADREVEVALPPASAGRTDWAMHLDRLYEHLREGRGTEAATLVRKVIADGAPAGEVYLKLLTPALHRVGMDWQEGRITVADEHRATEITTAIMARLGEFFRRRGPGRGTAVTLCPPDEQHAVGSAMAADFLRAGGWDVHHLGANVPIEDLRLFLQVVPTDVLCVSVTTPPTDPDVLRQLAEVGAESEDCLVVIGGQGAEPEAVERAGAVYVEDLTSLVERLDGASPS